MLKLFVSISLCLAFVLLSNGNTLASVTIRTGQVAGQPGNPVTGGFDDCFRWTRAPLCGDPVSNSAFSSEFASASSGSPAELVLPVGGWIPTLAADPNARWINWGRDASGEGDPASVLYACHFEMDPGCALVDIEIWWAVDDQLGDTPGSGANPYGIYVNGVPLAGTQGGGFSSQNHALITGVSVVPGLNQFHVYQRDSGCAYSGLILSAEITCTCSEDQVGEIHGRKFWDENCDGSFDEWEFGLQGWDIELTGPVNAVANTDSNGNYSFLNLPPGTYTVSEITQPGWILSSPPGGSYQMTLCGDIVVGKDFANCECIGDELLPPPPCTIGWLPFEEGAGSATLEVAGGNSGSFNGSPNWISGPVGTGLEFPTANDFVELASSSSPAFGSGAFSISTWIRSGNSDGLRKTILDKRTTAGGTTGFSLFLDGNRLGLEIAAGATTSYLSSGTVLTDDTWHHVVALVCRSEDPTNDSIRFYIDGTLDAQWVGGVVQQGDINNTAKLRIGQACVPFGPDPALDAKLDETMFFDCCLTVSEVMRLLSGVSSSAAYVPASVLPCGPTANLNMQICNFSPFPRTFTWTLAGTAGCNVPGPTTFHPSSGTVSLPHGPVWFPVSPIVDVPGWLTGNDTACFELMVFEHETGRCFSVPGVLRAPNWLWVEPDPVVSVPVGELFEFEFVVRNDSGVDRFVDVQILPWSSGNGGPSGNLSVDGLPPGEPVVRVVKIPPGETAAIGGNGLLTGFQPMDIQEVRLLVDSEGTGEFVHVASIPVFSILGDEVSEVEVEFESPEPFHFLPPDPIRIVPNPFREETEIGFELRQAERARVQVLDVTGRVLRELHDGPLPQGVNRFEWDGRNNVGDTVAPGVYWARLEGESGVRTGKVLHIR